MPQWEEKGRKGVPAAGVGAEDGELVVVVEEAVSPKEREQVLHEAREGKPRCSAELSGLVGGQARRKQGDSQYRELAAAQANGLVSTMITRALCSSA